jgi:hypothetical protein
MPTVLRVGQYRFFFYSDEGLEPPHIHIEAAERRAKFWLAPIEQTWNDGFRSGEITEIEKIITANINLLMEAWNEFFATK